MGSVRLVVMTTKQKKLIQRDGNSNEARNCWIEEIQVECMECNRSDNEEEEERIDLKLQHKTTRGRDSVDEHVSRRVDRIRVDPTAKLKRIHELKMENLSGRVELIR